MHSWLWVITVKPRSDVGGLGGEAGKKGVKRREQSESAQEVRSGKETHKNTTVAQAEDPKPMEIVDRRIVCPEARAALRRWALPAFNTINIQ
jgi:hypothetical protein